MKYSSHCHSLEVKRRYRRHRGARLKVRKLFFLMRFVIYKDIIVSGFCKGIFYIWNAVSHYVCMFYLFICRMWPIKNTLPYIRHFKVSQNSNTVILLKGTKLTWGIPIKSKHLKLLAAHGTKAWFSTCLRLAKLHWPDCPLLCIYCRLFMPVQNWFQILNPEELVLHSQV